MNRLTSLEFDRLYPKSLANFPTKSMEQHFLVPHFKTSTLDSNFFSLKTILSQSSYCTLLETCTVMLQNITRYIAHTINIYYVLTMDNMARCFRPLKYIKENIKKRTQPCNLQKRNQYPISHLPNVNNISPSH